LGRGQDRKKGFKKNADVCRKIIFLNGCLSEEKSAGITEGISFLEKKEQAKDRVHRSGLLQRRRKGVV
jgi:hypothetical protein